MSEFVLVLAGQTTIRRPRRRRSSTSVDRENPEQGDGRVSSILVVDDESEIRHIARVLLEGAGHTVEEAGSGEEGLARLGRGDLPDVVLLDIRMPGIDGWEVLQRLRGSAGALADLPVIIFTAERSQAQLAATERGENQYFLAKPFVPRDLIDLVGQVASD